MKKRTFTSILLLLISVAIFAQYNDADGTNLIKNDNTNINKDPMTQVFAEDVIVQGSIGVGMDVPGGYSFGFSTIAMLENNLRIRFDDTSNSASFPDNDWEITINDSGNGGQNYFRVNDITQGSSPFTIRGGAGSHALYVSNSGGNVGLGTDSPAVELQVTDGDSPTLRLEQNGTNGWTPQTWDVAGNETNFFVRDVTNGSKLPFKIKPGAPDNAIFVAANGNIGLGTANPQHRLEVKGDMQVDDYFYFGDESTDGNWRVSVVAGKLTFEKLEAGIWVSKVEMD